MRFDLMVKQGVSFHVRRCWRRLSADDVRRGRLGLGVRILMTLAMANADVYYKDCSEARAAGVTALYEGDPGYAPHLPGVALRELWTAARC